MTADFINEFGNDSLNYEGYLKKTIQRLKEAYNRPYRYYHNWSHIQTMRENFLKYEAMFSTKEQLILIDAILYHDVIYNPLAGSPVNEQDSTEYYGNDAVAMNDFLRERKQEPFGIEHLKKVNELIIDTSQHTRTLECDFMTQFFLDLDLMVLGESWEKYNEYRHHLMLEYICVGVPANSYIEGRIEFLSTMLHKDWIYYTDIFRLQYEQQAKKNMIKEMKQLTYLQVNYKKIGE